MAEKKEFRVHGETARWAAARMMRGVRGVRAWSRSLCMAEARKQLPPSLH